MIFTDKPEKRFQEFEDKDFVKIEQNLGIKYEKNEILEDTILLLRYNCPDKDCDVACLGWPDLHRHVRTIHGKVMCDLCTRNKKIFTHEHELFTIGELRKHERYGDDNPGAIDQSGFKGHPECGFCKQRFYGDDELYAHCREKHERCHICDRQNDGRSPQYYLNYVELEKHFAAHHFVCQDSECQANKTNVFESELDLKAHQLSEHPHGLSKDARRDARLVNLSGFSDLRTPYQPQHGGRRERDGHGRGRGRDPNAEPLPVSSAQPQSRAELAYQRQLAIQSSQSVSNRTFGGQLTQPPQTPQPHPSRPAAATQPEPSREALPEFEDLSIDVSSLSPRERARRLRHQSAIQRAQALLNNDPTKLTQFRDHVSSYRTDRISAPELIDTFFSLFDCSSSDLGKLIRELADLYEDEAKCQALLSAWNSWRSINEDYPTLPGPSGSGLPRVLGASSEITSYASATNSAPSSANLAASLGNNIGTGRRVLKLKSSTAQSRNATSGRMVPGLSPIPGVGISSSEAFPALSSTARPQGPSPPVWHPDPPRVVSTHISTAPRPVNLPPATSTSNPTTMSARQNEDMFPSLPKAPKPNVMISGFNTRAIGRLSGGSGSTTPNLSPWAAGGRAPTPGEAAAALNAAAVGTGSPTQTAEDGDAAGKGKRKGRKGKGETLFHFG